MRESTGLCIPGFLSGFSRSGHSGILRDSLGVKRIVAEYKPNNPALGNKTNSSISSGI